MKCDELKDYDYDPDFPFQSRGRFYVADEVEAAIDELKTENETLLQQNRELCRALQVMYTKEEYDKLKAENAELKQKLENAQASAYAESVDAGMENRRLKRALWLARAERALEKIAWLKLWNASISTMNPEDGARQEFDKWNKNLGKFLKKAEDYI